MHAHRLALALTSLLFACQTDIQATGSTGETGDDADGSTTMSDMLQCGAAPNSIVVDGTCWCEPGTTWVEPFNPNSFDCAPLEPRDGECDADHGKASGDGCSCVEYYTWCSVVTLDDTACCYDPAQDPDGSHAPPSETSTSDASTGDTSTGDTAGSTTADTDASSTGVETSTGETSSTGDASTDSSSSSSGASG